VTGEAHQGAGLLKKPAPTYTDDGDDDDTAEGCDRRTTTPANRLVGRCFPTISSRCAQVGVTAPGKGWGVGGRSAFEAVAPGSIPSYPREPQIN